MISCHAISLAPLELSTSSGIKHSQSLLAEWAYNAAGVAWVTRVVVTNPMIIVNELSYYRLKMKIFHHIYIGKTGMYQTFDFFLRLFQTTWLQQNQVSAY